MKSLLLGLALVTPAFAFDIPRGSHNLAQIDEACTKAAKAKQPVVFVIADKDMKKT